MNVKLGWMAALALAVGLCGCNRDTQPAPAAATPAAPVAAAPGAPVAVAAPTYYEEGATVDGTVLTEPTDVNDYVYVGGAYYYWHPSAHVWVHARHPESWKPREGAHVYHNWTEHPSYKRR